MIITPQHIHQYKEKMFVLCNYWNINSIYICCNARVYMHMTVYICIVCARSRACVCEQALHGGRRERHYSVCTFAGALGSRRLRGKNCLGRRRVKGQRGEVWTDGSPAFPSSVLITLIFALTDSAFSSRLKCTLHLRC